MTAPPVPMRAPMASTTTSSRMMDSATTTAPRAGRVSRPENGGAIAALRREADQEEAKDPQRPSAAEDPPPPRPREPLESTHPSHHVRDRRSLVSGPSSRRCHRFGNRSVRRPRTIWAATTTVMPLNTWVMPPVGSGKAGTNMRRRMVTAKLFSPKTSPQRAQRLRSVGPQPVLELVGEAALGEGVVGSHRYGASVRANASRRAPAKFPSQEHASHSRRNVVRTKHVKRASDGNDRGTGRTRGIVQRRAPRSRLARVRRRPARPQRLDRQAPRAHRRVARTPPTFATRSTSAARRASRSRSAAAATTSPASRRPTAG